MLKKQQLINLIKKIHNNNLNYYNAKIREEIAFFTEQIFDKTQNRVRKGDATCFPDEIWFQILDYFGFIPLFSFIDNISQERKQSEFTLESLQIRADKTNKLEESNQDFEQIIEKWIKENEIQLKTFLSLCAISKKFRAMINERDSNKVNFLRLMKKVIRAKIVNKINKQLIYNDHKLGVKKTFNFYFHQFDRIANGLLFTSIQHNNTEDYDFVARTILAAKLIFDYVCAKESMLNYNSDKTSFKSLVVDKFISWFPEEKHDVIKYFDLNEFESIRLILPTDIEYILKIYGSNGQDAFQHGEFFDRLLSQTQQNSESNQAALLSDLYLKKFVEKFFYLGENLSELPFSKEFFSIVNKDINKDINEDTVFACICKFKLHSHVFRVITKEQFIYLFREMQSSLIENVAVNGNDDNNLEVNKDVFKANNNDDKLLSLAYKYIQAILLKFNNFDFHTDAFGCLIKYFQEIQRIDRLSYCKEHNLKKLNKINTGNFIKFFNVGYIVKKGSKIWDDNEKQGYKFVQETLKDKLKCFKFMQETCNMFIKKVLAWPKFNDKQKQFLKKFNHKKYSYHYKLGKSFFEKIIRKYGESFYTNDEYLERIISLRDITQYAIDVSDYESEVKEILYLGAQLLPKGYTYSTCPEEHKSFLARMKEVLNLLQKIQDNACAKLLKFSSLGHEQEWENLKGDAWFINFKGFCDKNLTLDEFENVGIVYKELANVLRYHKEVVNNETPFNFLIQFNSKELKEVQETLKKYPLHLDYNEENFQKYQNPEGESGGCVIL